MRKVSKPLDSKPDILDFSKTPSTLEVLKQIIDNKRVEDKHGEIFRGTYKDEQGITQSKVRDELNKFYHKKCAYCESFESSAQIEHYRPKNKVIGTGKNNGYYWLCFEWTNLVPACFDCNKVGTGKGNRFPIISAASQRQFVVPFNDDLSLRLEDFIYNSVYLSVEKPFLLHPEYDEPKHFFKFEWKQNQSYLNLIGTDKENRGEKTIKICDLNRENLGNNRGQRLYDVIITPILANLGLFLNLQKTLIEFERDLFEIFKILKKRAKNEQLEFSLMWWFVFESIENFEQIIGATLPEGTQRNVVINLFKQFKSNT